MNNLHTIIISEYKKWTGDTPIDIFNLPASGSDRQYFRIVSSSTSCLAAFNVDVQENDVYFEMSKHFFNAGIAVPNLLHVSEDKSIYFVEDLGDVSLFDVLSAAKGVFTSELFDLYKASLVQLAKMQVEGGKNYDFTKTYPVAEFDRKSVIWDLNYFKYYYVKLMGVSFNELKLQNDFDRLADYLMQAPSDYFMFRDFQSRNIMVKDNKPYFIDFQGGRKGALQYDVASLLWQARAQLSSDIKSQLLDEYLNSLSEYINVDKTEFTSYYNAFVLIRVLQTLGAYGFRGLYEHKTHFVLSLPMAIENLRQIVEDADLLSNYPELTAVIYQLLKIENRPWTKQQPTKDTLTVYVGSFSYKKGLPVNYTAHGGGHVFDCRAIHNPGRYTEYKQLTGRDQPVIDFLDNTQEMQDFLDSVTQIVDHSVNTYLRRGFDHLSIQFGCTGGQHRSVYSAEKIFSHIKNNYPVRLVLCHREQNVNAEEYGKKTV